MDTSCSICREEFTPDKTIPKVLVECGHTFCCSCISQITQRWKTCPDCRTPLTKGNGESYPTNYLVLSSLGKKTDKPFERLKALRAKLAVLKLDITQIDKALKVRPATMDSESVDRLTTDVRKHIKDLATNMAEESDIKINTNLTNFKESRHFLYEISTRLFRGEKVYTAHRVNHRIMYGNVCVENNSHRLKVYALTLSMAEKNALIVSFEDLKKCFVEGALCVFLELRHDKGHKRDINIDLNGSPLAIQFYKLCTGEEGPMYVGSEFRYDYNGYIIVEKYMKDGFPTQRTLDFTSYFPTLVNVSGKKGVVEGSPTGRFVVKTKGSFRAYSKSDPFSNEETLYMADNVLGEVAPQEYHTGSYGRIEQCGFYVNF